MSLFNSKMQRLIVGKLRSDTGGNGARGKLLNRGSIPHCIKTRSCSCCSKPWKTKPNAQGLLQLKSSVDVQKPHDVKTLACDATFHGLNELNWLPWPANPTANPSTWVELISWDDAPSPASNALGLPCANSMEKSELTDSLNQEATLFSSPELITLHHDPQVVGNLTTCEETRINNMEIASPNELEDHSTLISTEVEDCPKIDGVVNQSSSENTYDDTNHSSDSESSKSDKEHEVNFATRQPLESSSGNTNDDSNHNSDSESSKSDKEHEVKFSTKSPLESSSGKTKDDSDHNSDSESSESDKKHEVKFATRQSLEKANDIVTNNLKQPSLINTSVEECSKTNEVVYEVEECSKTNEVVYEDSIRNTNDDKDHNSVSESSKSDEEHEVFKFTTDQPLEKRMDLLTNDLKESPLISTTVEEFSKIDEVVYVSTYGNIIDDMVDHNSANESSDSDKEQEVINFSEGKSSEKETNLVTNGLNESLLINTTVEEFPKIDEVVYVSAYRNIIDDVDHNNANESSDSDKDQEIINFSIGQSSEKETNLVTNDLNESHLITTTVEKCPKTDEEAYESIVKNINDDMDIVSESTDSDKEQEDSNFTIGQPLEKVIDLVTNDLKESPSISTTVEEFPKIDEVVYVSTSRNTIDDADHNNANESFESDKEQEVINFSMEESSEKETNLVTNDIKESLLIRTIDQSSTVDEVVYESSIMITNDDIDHSSISESSVDDMQQEVFNFPLKTESNITNDMEQFHLQNNVAELINQSSSDDEGHNFSISYDDVQEKFASRFSTTPTFHRSVSMESVESLDGSNVSEIEGENIVDRLKRQVEYDKKSINSLYKELEEERSASEVAASQAMAMITRLQEEKAAMHMEALQYLRMMEEQAEYDVEALEKANELLNEKERDIQDLEAELEYYRSNYMVDTIAETEPEKSDCANDENITAENDIVEHHEYNANYSFKSILVDSSKASYRSFNNQNSSFEFEDEKSYIQLCLRSLEDKMNKIFTNGLLARVPNSIDIEEEVVNPEQKEEEESKDAERSQRNNEENGPSMHIDQNNDRFDSEENCHDMKDPISCANKREEVDFLALENKISNLTGRLEALQGDYDFLEHSLNSLHYGEDGLQFAQNIVHQLHELCKLGIRLDRQPGS